MGIGRRGRERRKVMEKGRGKGTDTLPGDNDYLRRGDVKRLLENVVCLHEELPAQIDLIPAADVAPVVRCKDCRYAYDSVGGWCCSYGICVDCVVREDFFCADGERKDGDEV